MNELDLPHNLEAEQVLLGSILGDNRGYDNVATFLTAEDFFEPVHGRIFDVVGRYIVRGDHVSPVTLKNHFEHDETLAEIGGSSYLAKLATAAVRMSDVEQYGRTIYDLAIRRKLVEIGAELQERARDGASEEEPRVIVEVFDTRLTEILHGSNQINPTVMTAGQAAEIAVYKASEAYRLEGKSDAVGLATGLPSVDAKLGPLEGGMQIIIAGATSMGKTAFAQQIGLNNALLGKRGLVFSQEMKGYQFTRRWISQLAEVDSSKIRLGRFTPEEYERIVEAQRRISKDVMVTIDEARGLNVRQIAARARSVKRHGGLDFMIVDYLQLLAAMDPRIPLAQQVAQNSAALRNLAGDLDVPMLLLSQLSRNFASRDNKRPQLQDLRDSGAIEQDADAVVFVHREQYYLEKAEPEAGTSEYLKWQAEMEKWQGKSEVIIPKLREGAAGGTAMIGFHAPLTKFHELTDPPTSRHFFSTEELEAQEAMAI